MPNNTKQKVFILGDSTIDNKVWLGKEKYHLFLGSRFPVLHTLIDFIAWFNPFKAKSVVENLRAQMPNIDFFDNTNDGFTTTDVLKGAYRDKVFGRNVHRFFPHHFFKPFADEESLKKSDHIILSVGGNNFREFIQSALQITNAKKRKEFIEQQYPTVFAKMRNEYKAILRKIAQTNSNAHIILMTQYYPALNQKTLLGTSIYEFMKELGSVRNTGDAEKTIVKVMQDTYNDILKFISTDALFAKRKISIVDVTSSLNPHESSNYVGQIEPSDQGGKHIGKMLSHVIRQNKTVNQKLYRFSPAFFTASASDESQYVYDCQLNAKTAFAPVEPYQFKIPTNWKRIVFATMGGIGASAALPILFGTTNLLWLAGVGLLGAKLAWEFAKWLQIGLSAQCSEKQIYAFSINKNVSAETQAMERFGFAAAKGWFPYLKSCLPFNGAYRNEAFNRGYQKGHIETMVDSYVKKTVAEIGANYSSDEIRGALSADRKCATSKLK